MSHLRCQGKTRLGKQCSKKVKNDGVTLYCYLHGKSKVVENEKDFDVAEQILVMDEHRSIYKKGSISGRILKDYPWHVILKNGKIYSLLKNKFLKENTNTEYKSVCILHLDRKNFVEEGKKKVSPVPIHKLVTQAYHENTNNFPIIDHKDMNKHNNRADNLEWVTHSENALRARAMKRNTSSDKKVCQIDEEGNIICIYESIAEAFRKTGINNISDACYGRGYRKTAGGFIWKIHGDTLEKEFLEKEKNDKIVEGEMWWRAGSGILSKYKISNLGRVYSKHRGKYIKLSISEGYYQLKISGESYAVHRLVIKNFLGDAPKDI